VEELTAHLYTLKIIINKKIILINNKIIMYQYVDVAQYVRLSGQKGYGKSFLTAILS
jgi:hypothetical protein